MPLNEEQNIFQKIASQFSFQNPKAGTGFFAEMFDTDGPNYKLKSDATSFLTKKPKQVTANPFETSFKKSLVGDDIEVDNSDSNWEILKNTVKGLPKAYKEINAEMPNAFRELGKMVADTTAGIVSGGGLTGQDLTTSAKNAFTNPAKFVKDVHEGAKLLKDGVLDLTDEVKADPVKAVQSVVGSTAKGISTSVTNAMLNNFVAPEEREAVRAEVQATLDKYLGATPETGFSQGFEMAGETAPLLAAGGIAGSAGAALGPTASAVANTAGFIGYGQASLPREAAFEDRAEQAMKDLVALGVFTLGSYGYNVAKAVVKDNIAKVQAKYDEVSKTVNPEAGFIKNPLGKKNDGEMKDFAPLVRTGTRERGFVTTVKEADITHPEVAKKIESNYNPINNKDTFEKARKLVEENLNEADRIAASDRFDADSNAVRQLLIVKAQNEGRINDAVRMVEELAVKATEKGQAIQSLAAFNRLTPEGILSYTQKQIDAANKNLPPKKQVKLTDELANDLVKTSQKIQKMPDGELKAVETARMLKKITDIFPVDILKKVSTFQTLVQLLNPKTMIRNVGGNAGFSALENVADFVGAGLDSALSNITGVRSKTIPDIMQQLSSGKKGFQEGIRDALFGIDMLGVPTQFDLPKTAVFKGPVGKAAQKTLDLMLKAPDRAFYKAAYDGSLYNQMKAAKVKEPTEAMKEIAHLDGLYRTFQDDSALSKMFTGFKKALNLGKDFGLGDIVLKYPKTPANILSRGIAYSPAGFLKTVYEAARPLVGQGRFNQKAFVESFSRALVGTTGLVGTGALMHRLGLITGQRESDKDIATLQQETGLGQYKINVSGLKRFALSGGDPEAAKLQSGDKLVSYDWLQPSAIGISIGANIDEGLGTSGTSLATTIIDSMANGVDTLAEQPLVQGLTRILKFGDASDAIIAAGEQIPSSFVPTLLNQIRQLVDNTKRNVYDPDRVQYAFNLAKNRIPFVAEHGIPGLGVHPLPPKVGVFGEDQEVYQNASNNLFNVFFNPAFVTTYKPTPEAKLVLDLFEQGYTNQAPRVVNTTQTVNGEKIKLGETKVMELQRFVGTVTKELFHSFATNPGFQAQSDEDKVKYMQSVLTSIGSAAKIWVLGEREFKRAPSQMTQELLQWYGSTNLPMKVKPANPNGQN